MMESTYTQFDKWQQNGKLVCILKVDNAIENKIFQKRYESGDEKLGIGVEYTKKDMLQKIA